MVINITNNQNNASFAPIVIPGGAFLLIVYDAIKLFKK